MAAARDGVTGVRVDGDDDASLQSFADEISARFPELNVLVANAGVSQAEDLTSGWDMSVSEAMVRTNILGTLRTVRAVLPLLQRQPNATLITTTSNLAFMPRASLPTYCATKAFLHSWLQSLRHQLRAFPIEVLELAPPYVRTALTGAHQATDPRGMATDGYVAEVMGLLETGDHPDGEILVERAKPERLAERSGRYGAVYAAMHPS